MKTRPTSRKTDARALPKRNPKTGRFEKTVAKEVAARPAAEKGKLA